MNFVFVFMCYRRGNKQANSPWAVMRLLKLQKNHPAWKLICLLIMWDLKFQIHQLKTEESVIVRHSLIILVVTYLFLDELAPLSCEGLLEPDPKQASSWPRSQRGVFMSREHSLGFCWGIYFLSGGYWAQVSISFAKHTSYHWVIHQAKAEFSKAATHAAFGIIETK